MNIVRRTEHKKFVFPGNLADLMEWVRLTSLPGDWEKMPAYWRFRCRNGAILNWWPSTGTINFQGPSREKYKLIAWLACAFDDPAVEWPEWLGEEPSHSTKAITYEPDEGDI